MFRVSTLLPSWDRSRQSTSAPTPAPAPPTPAKTPGALDKVFGWAEKIVPATRNSTLSTTAPARYGRETYWPTTLDKECDKAARILKSFCFDGFLSQESDQTDAGTTQTQPYVTKKIPPRIIQNAVGLAVFSCMRSGLWMSGSGGAGLITARKADGTWSPPSGIILHTAELAFLAGVDIYDCLLVINSVHILELFTRPRLVLGVDVSLAMGPLATVGGKEPEIKWREISDTVLTYVKARGKHQAVQLDGSMVTERGNENEKFYCAGITILDILAGNTPKHVEEMRPLFEVIKAAEGRSDYDKALMNWLAQQPAPGDAEIATPPESIKSPTKIAFGVLDANDPDPFGIIGLEMAGIEIREAGSTLRPSSSQFDFHANPTSPVFGRFSRQSMETFVSRSNRGSCVSAKTQNTVMTDAYTQTDVASTADTTYSRPNSDDGKDAVDRLPTVVEPDEVDYTQVDMSFLEHLKRRPSEAATVLQPLKAPEEVKETRAPGKRTSEIKSAEKKEKSRAVDQATGPITLDEIPQPTIGDEASEDADDEDDEDEEEPIIICEVATATTQPARASIQKSQVTQVIQAKAGLVTIPKRIPPPLPARSPARASRGSKSEYGGDLSSLKSPVRNSFLSISSRPDDSDPVAERLSIDEKPVAGERSSMDESPAPEAPPPNQKTTTTSPPPRQPRHTKNSSSVCTTIAAATATTPLSTPALA
ncbi:hypothetical protein N0V88_005007 [Collariella sp. IMI 366227]|nr:hypothetical protein N0V88_005007 [Collariella sp. IMI 366227]